jgi:myo-inositol-1(or 4)-monophosphatase
MLNSATITVITNAVHKAARGVVRDFGEVDKLQISKKGAANFVTNADVRTEKILLEELTKARPKVSFLTEESGEIWGEDRHSRFVIDPIDGTTNFIHAIPYISISIAFQKKNAKDEWISESGVVYDPIHDELFAAERGKGAFAKNMRLRVSTRKEDLLLSTSSPRKWRDGNVKLDMFQRAVESGSTVRCSGSAALDLAYVAAGRLDGTWYHRLNAWDMAAGALIVREAGGEVGAIEGGLESQERGSIIAANPHVFQSLQALLQKAA